MISATKTDQDHWMLLVWEVLSNNNTKENNINDNTFFMVVFQTLIKLECFREMKEQDQQHN